MACAFLCIFSKHAIASQLNSLKVLPRPERLTELYFTDHARLPVTSKAGRKQAVAFTVHNLEHQATTYNYTIIAQADGKQQALASGTITLQHDTLQHVTRTIVAPPLGPRIEIRVRLEYSGTPLGQDSPRNETQAIHYWTNAAP